MHTLVKIEYGDFDIPFNTTLFVSSNAVTLEQKCEELNNSRTSTEIDEGVEYSVLYKQVKLL
jgi:hypothetical protein